MEEESIEGVIKEGTVINRLCHRLDFEFRVDAQEFKAPPEKRLGI